MTAAAAAGEAPEVIHALMLDVAEALDAAGEDSSQVRGYAATMVPMFGMHVRYEPRTGPWWRPRRRVPVDYAARVRAYRDGTLSA